MAGLLSAVTFACGTISLSLAHLDRRWKLTSRVLLAVFALSFLAAVTLPAYSPQHPKRVVAQHVRRQWHAPYTHNASSLSPSPSPPRSVVTAACGSTRSTGRACAPCAPSASTAAAPTAGRRTRSATAQPMACQGVYCEMPYFYPFKKLVTDGVYLPAPPPLSTEGDGGGEFGARLLLTRVEARGVGGVGDRHRRRYHFVSEGAHHQVLLLRNVLGRERSAELVGWSFHREGEYHPMRAPGGVAKAVSTFPSLGPFYDEEAARDREAREDYFTFFSSGTPDYGWEEGMPRVGGREVRGGGGGGRGGGEVADGGVAADGEAVGVLAGGEGQTQRRRGEGEEAHGLEVGVGEPLAG